MVDYVVNIVGKGAWGKALYHVVKQNTKKVSLVGRGETGNADIFILAVPTQSLRDVRNYLHSTRKKPIIINTAKGIERLTHLTPQEIIKETIPECHYFSLIGPSFASEVMRNMPTVVNLGYEKPSKLTELTRDILQTDFFRVKPTNAIRALELAGALKNIYAIGCGLADGLGYQENTRIQLIMLALEEMQQLFRALRLHTDRFSLPGTVGDLILTCTSSESRNFRFGHYLAVYSPEKSLEKVGSTVEGYSTLNSLRFLEVTAGVSLPLANLIKQVASHEDTTEAREHFEHYLKSS